MRKEDETLREYPHETKREIPGTSIENSATASRKFVLHIELLYGGLYIANGAVELCEEVAPNFATFLPQKWKQVFIVAYTF